MRYFFLLVTLATLAFSAWVSAPTFGFPLGGMSQKDISDLYPSPITPAPYTFSIWSVIYLSWCILAISLLISPKRRISKKTILPLTIAIALSAIWLIPWAYNQIGIALLVILAIFVILTYTFFLSRSTPPLERVTVELFLGWIHIATIANLVIWGVATKTLTNLNQEYVAIFALTLALVLTLFYQIRYRAYTISLIFLWALGGIWIAQSENILEEKMIFFSAFCAILAMIFTFFWKKK